MKRDTRHFKLSIIILSILFAFSSQLYADSSYYAEVGTSFHCGLIKANSQLAENSVLAGLARIDGELYLSDKLLAERKRYAYGDVSGYLKKPRKRNLGLTKRLLAQVQLSGTIVLKDKNGRVLFSSAINAPLKGLGRQSKRSFTKVQGWIGTEVNQIEVKTGKIALSPSYNTIVNFSFRKNGAKEKIILPLRCETIKRVTILEQSGATKLEKGRVVVWQEVKALPR